MERIERIVTHPGGAHKDEFLACCLLASQHGAEIFRREPESKDLEDPFTAVVDVGGSHDPALANFDHHQFPRHSEPVCALSLVLQDLDLYEDAREFCEWLETAERFDCEGPNRTADWLGVDRDAMAKLISPIDVTILRRFAAESHLKPGDVLYTLMQWIGGDLVSFLLKMQARLSSLKEHGVMWEIEGRSVFFVPRQEPFLDDPSFAIRAHLDREGILEENGSDGAPRIVVGKDLHSIRLMTIPPSILQSWMASMISNLLMPKDSSQRLTPRSLRGFENC